MQPESRPHIDFLKPRDVSSVINATFSFFRDEFRGLVRALVMIVGPVVVVSAILTAGEVQTMYQGILDPEYWLTEDSVGMGIGYFLGAMLNGIASFLAIGVFYAYAMLYVETGRGGFEPREVWGRLKQDLWPYLSTGLWAVLLIAVPAVVVVIPCFGALAWMAWAAYLFPVVMLVYPARFERKEGFWPAFKRCRDLIKGSWWPSFGLLVVTWIVVMVTGTAVFGVSMLVYTMLFQLIGEGVLMSAVSVLLSVVSVVWYLLYALPSTAFVVQYFSLVEQVEGVNLEARIEAIAGEPASTDSGSVSF